MWWLAKQGGTRPWNRKEKIQHGPNIIYWEKKSFPGRFYCKYLTKWHLQCLKAISAMSIINCCLMVAITFDMQLRTKMEVASCSSWLLSFWRISEVLSHPFLTFINTSLAFIYCNKGGYTLLCLAVAALALHKHFQQLGVSLNPGVPAAAPSVKESVETDATGERRKPPKLPPRQKAPGRQQPMFPGILKATDLLRRAIDKDLVQCFFLIEENWKWHSDLFVAEDHESPPWSCVLLPTHSFCAPCEILPLPATKGENTMEGEWPAKEEEQDLSMSLEGVSCCRATFVGSCELSYSDKRERKWLKWVCDLCSPFIPVLQWNP